MDNFTDMLWIEWRKAVRSKMPLWTALGSLFMPFGIAFLIFVSRNPQISRQLGLISAKADLVKYAATDWPTYLALFAMLIAAGGFFLFVLVVSWIFGREFADGTLKDMLAVPVRRATILAAKFSVAAGWSVGLAAVILIAGLITGAAIGLPGGTPGVLLHGAGLLAGCAGLTIAVVLPFAFFASAGRGYLLPVGMAILALMSANLVMLLGWGELYPWAVPGLFSQGPGALPPASYGVVVLTCLAGMVATYYWWKNADQSR